MKNKNIVFAVVAVILLLLLGVGGFLMLNKNSGVEKKIATNETQNSDSKQTAKSLLDLVKMGQNLRCTFSTQLSNGSTEGTVYISGQNVRGDFNVKTGNENPMQTSMIKNGDTTYIWGSTMEGKGVKMTIDLDKMAEDKQASQYVDPNQKVNYNCSAWSVDSTLFTPPSNVEFSDLSSLMMPNQTETTTDSNPCSQIADATAKAACENALKQSGQ